MPTHKYSSNHTHNIEIRHSFSAVVSREKCVYLMDKFVICSPFKLMYVMYVCFIFFCLVHCACARTHTHTNLWENIGCIVSSMYVKNIIGIFRNGISMCWFGPVRYKNQTSNYVFVQKFQCIGIIRGRGGRGELDDYSNLLGILRRPWWIFF